MRLVVLALVLLSTSLARADKIAVIDSHRLYEKGGLTRWLAARAKLDEERKKFKVVESPDGKKPPTPKDCSNYQNKVLEDMCKSSNEMEKRSHENEVWEEHERTVLDPIEREITDTLQAFAKARGITVLFEKEETMLYVAPGADITDAFIKDFNARPAPKPKK